MRDQPGVRHANPEPHQRAVRRVLLHRLERERVVQQVDVVHQRDLLQPRARQVVPPRQPVDHQRVPGLRSEVERLVADPLRAQGVPVDRAEARDQRSNAAGQSSSVRGAIRSGAQTNRADDERLTLPGRPVCGTSFPEIHLVAMPFRRGARRSASSTRARRSCPPLALPTDKQERRLDESQPRWSPGEVGDVVHRVVEVDGVAALAASLGCRFKSGDVVDAGSCNRDREEVGPLEAEIRRVVGADEAPVAISSPLCASAWMNGTSRVSTHHS